MRLSYFGNFAPAHSTESHVAASFEALGHTVIRIQEGATRASTVADITINEAADLFLHTQTYPLAVRSSSLEDRTVALKRIQVAGILTAFFHLDLWWGLDRAVQLYEEPWIHSDFVFTADGGHNKEWEQLGVNHIWLPPGVYHAEAHDGQPRRPYTSDVAFVGSWRHYGHTEHWPVRKAMLDALRRRYRNRFRCWPQTGAIRGERLNSLYASATVVVGDSCLAGEIPNYWSDRVAETTGRGGFLIHPHVKGILDQHPSLATFEPGNWDELIGKVDYYLTAGSARESLRVTNAAWTRERHTYKNRAQTILETVGLA